MKRIKRAAEFLRESIGAPPPLALVLGSGLGGLADELADARTVSFGDVPGWPVSGVEGHEGVLATGRLGGVPVAVMRGRVHLYEGWSAEEVVRPLRTLVRAGVRGLVVTNAAGGIREDLAPGDLMLIADHLNLTGENPLRGRNLDGLGPRFPDLSAAYEGAWFPLAEAAAGVAGIRLRRGVYAAMAGPSFETPAEIRMLRALGADAVGMSTVPEVIAARHAGARVLGISLVTNLAAGVSAHPLSHEEVTETGERVKGPFSAMLRSLVAAIAGREGWA